MNPIADKVAKLKARIDWGREMGFYFYLQPVKNIDGARVVCDGRTMLLFASYSYLGLIGHPKINDAAKAAVDEYGTGTHGVRILAGSLKLHRETEEKIAAFNGTEDAMVFSSGYVTNLATVSTLVGRDDVVFCDKLNHASIVDGCILSRARFVRCRHNDMEDLERCLAAADPAAGKLVVADAVFSMDGDIINLPEMHRICKKYRALLMVDEAHSLGVLGKTGRGIEEHFGMQGSIDIKMGTLSKTVPSVQLPAFPRRSQGPWIRHSPERDGHRADHLREGRADAHDDQDRPGARALRPAGPLTRGAPGDQPHPSRGHIRAQR